MQSSFITMHNLTGCSSPLTLALLFVMFPNLAGVFEFSLLTLSVEHSASDLVPLGRTKHGGRFIKRSGNNCHLNVKSSGLNRDGIGKIAKQIDG